MKIPDGWRRLRGTDIIRKGDGQWLKNADISFTEDSLVYADYFVGKSVYELGCGHGNYFYRKLNAPK